MPEFSSLPLLKEPPLIEVVYSLQAITDPALQMESVRGRVEHGLPAGFEMKPINKVQVRVNAGGEGRSVSEQAMEWGGFRITNPNGLEVLHMMREGLFVSFLPPYKGFAECIQNIERYWNWYVEAFAPESSVRIGIRYINRMDVPLKNGVVEFEQYFKLVTYYPVDGPFQLHRFHTQFEISDLELNIPARVSFTSTKESKDNLEVILDIEAFDEGSWSAQDQQIWPRFDQLRHWAYRLFRNTLTDECFQRYQ